MSEQVYMFDRLHRKVAQLGTTTKIVNRLLPRYVELKVKRSAARGPVRLLCTSDGRCRLMAHIHMHVFTRRVRGIRPTCPAIETHKFHGTERNEDCFKCLCMQHAKAQYIRRL
jgi:hypothetical protein